VCSKWKACGGHTLQGTVRNVVDFGIVDIGVNTMACCIGADPGDFLAGK
jgi:hypothetical protein